MSTYESDPAVDALLNYAKKCADRFKELQEENTKLKNKNNELTRENINLTDENIKLQEKNKEINVDREKIDKKVSTEQNSTGYDKKDKSRFMEKIKKCKSTPVKTRHIGLVVICYHATFSQTKNVPKRKGATQDATMMEKAWESYGCKVVKYPDETNLFYTNALINNVETELQSIPDLRLFVFVLSSHGDEKTEVDLKTKEAKCQHYFCTKDGQLRTQDLINSIAGIEKLKEKLKFFVMQTCRSRTLDGHDANIDRGCVVKTDDMDTIDAIVHANGNDNDVVDEAHKAKDAKSSSLDTMVLVPYCDDCIVLFASMAGKYAYRQKKGSRLIQALYNTLIYYQKGDKVNILDILRKVNFEVGKMEVRFETTKDGKKKEEVVKTQSCFYHNITFELNELVLEKSPA